MDLRSRRRRDHSAISNIVLASLRIAKSSKDEFGAIVLLEVSLVDLLFNPFFSSLDCFHTILLVNFFDFEHSPPKHGYPAFGRMLMVRRGGSSRTCSVES